MLQYDAMASLSADEKFALITENLAEVLNPEIIQKVLEENERPLKIYWGKSIAFIVLCVLFRCFSLLISVFRSLHVPNVAGSMPS